MLWFTSGRLGDRTRLSSAFAKKLVDIGLVPFAQADDTIDGIHAKYSASARTVVTILSAVYLRISFTTGRSLHDDYRIALDLSNSGDGRQSSECCKFKGDQEGKMVNVERLGKLK